VPHRAQPLRQMPGDHRVRAEARAQARRGQGRVAVHSPRGLGRPVRGRAAARRNVLPGDTPLPAGPQPSRTARPPHARRGSSVRRVPAARAIRVRARVIHQSPAAFPPALRSQIRAPCRKTGQRAGLRLLPCRCEGRYRDLGCGRARGLEVLPPVCRPGKQPPEGLLAHGPVLRCLPPGAVLPRGGRGRGHLVLHLPQGAPGQRADGRRRGRKLRRLPWRREADACGPGKKPPAARGRVFAENLSGRRRPRGP